VTNAELAGNLLLQTVGEPGGIKRLQTAVLGHYASDEGGVFEVGRTWSLRYVPYLSKSVRKVGR
jgi:hypothetical protein